MPDSNTGRLLVIEGGGSRALSSIIFLKRFGEIYGDSNMLNIFDGFASNSAGSIVAAGLAYGKTLDELETFFREESPWIFTTSSTTPGVKATTLDKIFDLTFNLPFYSNDYLVDLLDAQFGEDTLQDLQKPVVFASVNFTNKSIVLFSNKEHPYFIGQNFKIKDCVLASAAAQLYLPQVLIDGFVYEDGGIWANNPVNQGMSMLRIARAIKRMCVLGVSTGRGPFGFDDLPPDEPASDYALARLMNLIGEMIAGPAEGNDLALNINANFNMFPVNYFRFQYRIDPPWSADPDTTSPEFFQYITDKTNDFVDDNMESITQFVNKLKA